MKKAKASYFDLLVVDYNLKGGAKGSDLVKDLRDLGHYTDIIFYTRRASIPDDVVTEVSRGGFVMVVPDDELTNTTQAVIRERLERFGKVSFLRGSVISAFVEVESALNKLLMSYFQVKEGRQNHFRTSILENSTISFGAKVNALLMIMFGRLKPRKTDPIVPPFASLDRAWIICGIETVRRVEQSRNNLAHCIVRTEKQLEVFTMGEKICYERKDVVKVLSDMRACLQFIDKLSSCLSSGQNSQDS